MSSNRKAASDARKRGLLIAGIYKFANTNEDELGRNGGNEQDVSQLSLRII